MTRSPPAGRLSPHNQVREINVYMPCTAYACIPTIPLPRDVQAEQAALVERTFQRQATRGRLQEVVRGQEWKAPQQGTALNVQLHDRERDDRDRSMSGWRPRTRSPVLDAPGRPGG